MSSDNLPASLKGMKDYLMKAEQFKKIDPVVSVYCKVYALEKGLKERDKSDKAANEFLMQVMSQVESEKKALGPIEDAQMQVELMAMKVFDKGDKQYREGKADVQTVKTLRAAGHLFDVCTQFFPDNKLPFDMEEKHTYAKVKATEIFAAFKDGRTLQPSENGMPMPPPDCPPPAGDLGVTAVPGVPDMHETPAAPSAVRAPPPAAAQAPPPSLAAEKVKKSKCKIPPGEMAQAEKHTKYALSAIQFEDIKEAVSNLREALRILQEEPH